MWKARLKSWMLFALMATLLIACESKDAFGTNTQALWCQRLLEAAPTASTQDTEQTREEVADVGEVIDTLCPPVSTL